MSDDNADQELAAMLAASAAANAQTEAAMRDLATLCGTFRTQLILNGFTTEGAERMTGDYFQTLLDSSMADRED